VDIYEFGGVNWFLWDKNWNNIGSHTNICRGAWPNSTDGNFHTYAFSRINGVYTFYYDGSSFCTLNDPRPPNFTDSQDQFFMQNKTETGVPNGSGLPAESQLDYIRVYHP